MVVVPIPTMTIYEQARERLQSLKTELATLTKNNDDLSRKDRVKQGKDIERLKSQIDNFEALLEFKLDQPVTDGKSLGVIKDLTISQGGLPECWVSWYGKVQISEQPLRLINEPILEHSMKVGAVVRFKGQSGEISEFLGDGRVKTTEGDIIDFKVAEQGKVTVVENQGNSMNNDNDAPLVDSEVVNDDDITSDDAKLVVFEKLTAEEEAERLRLENIVKQSFAEAGRALKELRDKRLYRSTHNTFEEYCRDVFGMKRAHPYRLIEASVVVDHLSEFCLQFGDILPTNEAQCRPLTKLSPEDQVAAWLEAVKEAGGKTPSSRIVEKVVRDRLIPRYAPNPFYEGDIVEIMVKGNPDLRGRGGQWGIIDEVFEFSCMVKVWDGTIQVRIENMKDLVIPPEQKDAVRRICERCHRLIEVEGINDMAKAALASLSKKTWLSSDEDGILGYIEGIYFGGDGDNL